MAVRRLCVIADRSRFIPIPAVPIHSHISINSKLE